MTDPVQSAMFEILKRIQTDVSDIKGDVAILKIDVSSLKADVAVLKADVAVLKRNFEGLERTTTHLDARMERVERLIRRQTRDNAGMLVMMRATAGAFDERMLIMEDDLRILKEPIG